MRWRSGNRLTTPGVRTVMDRNLHQERLQPRGVRAVTTLGPAQFVVLLAGLALLAAIVGIALIRL